MVDHQEEPMEPTEQILVKLGQNISDQMKDDKYSKVMWGHLGSILDMNSWGHSQRKIDNLTGS